MSPTQASDPAAGPAAAPGRLRAASITDRRLFQSASITVVSRVGAKLAQLVFLVAAARLLPIGEFAEYSYAVALVATFVALGDSGVALVASREVSSGKLAAGAAYWSILPVVAVAGSLVALALVLAGQVDDGPGSAGSLLAICAAYLAANAIANLGATMLRGVGRIGLEAGLQIGGAVAAIAAATAAALAGVGAEGIVAAFMAKEVALACVFHAALRGDAGARRRPSWPLVRRLARRAATLALATTALALALRVPLIAVGNLDSAREVALLSAPLRLAESTFMLFSTVGFALLPGLALLGATDPARSRGVSRSALATTLVGCVAVTAMAVPFAGTLLELLFGVDYRDATSAARILLAATALYGLVGVGWYAALANGRDALAAKTAAAGLAAGIAASAALVPGEGIVGAAWAFVATFAVMTAGLAVGLWRD